MYSSSVYAGWSHLSRANCYSINESVSWNQTAWDGNDRNVYIESWHKKYGQPGNTAHVVRDGWAVTWRIRGGDTHLAIDYEVIGRHLRSFNSGFIKVVRTDAVWCNLADW